MNGRCDNDPLDIADEICGICGGEFCHGCVIKTRISNAKLVCKTCALDHSGLRSGDKRSVASRNRIRRAKRELTASTLSSSSPSGFTYFDDPGSEFEFDPERAAIDLKAENSKTHDLPEQAGDSVSDKASNPGRRLLRLGRLTGRRKGDNQSGQTTKSQLEESATSTSHLASSDEDPQLSPSSAVENVDPSPTEASSHPSTTHPSATPKVEEVEEVEEQLPPPPVAESPTPSATDLLTKLKETGGATTGQPQTRPAEPVHVDLNDSPFATGFEPVSVPTNADPNVNPPPSTRPQPAEPISPGHGPTDLSASPFGDPFTSPTPIGATREHTASTLQGDSGPAGEMRGAPSLDPSRADTDVDGNWIPPILRGMAPVVERENNSLPRRRSGDA